MSLEPPGAPESVCAYTYQNDIGRVHDLVDMPYLQAAVKLTFHLRKVTLLAINTAKSSVPGLVYKDSAEGRENT